MFLRRAGKFSLHSVPFLLIPCVLLAIVAFSGFRHTAVLSLPGKSLSDPLQLPPGWSTPPVPSDNPITAEKFALGRQLFFDVALSGDNKTSCSSCHNPRISFAARGVHAGAFGDTVRPLRNVPRLVNLAYDTVLMWDGHFHTLEEQVQGAVLKKGELQADTSIAFGRLLKNPAYAALFTQAFGDGTITLDRIAKAIATFERCLISGNSPYDQYLNGDTSAFSSSARRGMQLFFDTSKTNCSGCHNNLGSKNSNALGNIFSDNNYYRTGTFESLDPRFGYGLDTTTDTIRFLDAGRAAVTGDSMDIGRFRTPTLRNAALTPPFGANGSIGSLNLVLSNYNHGGGNTTDGGKTFERVFNQDARIKPLHLDSSQVQDIAAFINSLTDLSFISNPAFQDPGAAAVQIDDRIVSDNLSLYPNPASGFVNVESPDLRGPTEAILISENGATVWRETLVANGRLHLVFTGIANGTYWLELQQGNMSKTIKIVIER